MKKKRRVRSVRQEMFKTGLNRHHLFFPRYHYREGFNNDLREYWYCIVYIPKDTLHKTIHAEVQEVPLPSPESAQDVLKHLEYLLEYGAISENDTIQKRLQVLVALLECREDATVKALQEQLKIVNEFCKPP